MIFGELEGVLSPGDRVPVGREGRVVISRLSRGSADCTPSARATIKYVGAGTEIYRLGGRNYAVSAGQFLLVPRLTEGAVEIGRSADGDAFGLCLFLPETWEGPSSGLDEPVLFPAQCSALGRSLALVHGQLHRSPAKHVLAQQMLDAAATHLEPFLEEATQLLEGVDAVRSSTRHDLLRRLNVARSYLHSITDRPVDLAELASVAGTSRFHLLRNFRRCFGAPPAAYHRRLRLDLARKAIEACHIGCGEAAHRFGFADSSSFSHAYRRTFGHSPTRSAKGME